MVKGCDGTGQVLGALTVHSDSSGLAQVSPLTGELRALEFLCGPGLL